MLQAFARWANNELQKRSLVINDIDHDLRTGTLLISLVEVNKHKYNYYIIPTNRCINNNYFIFFNYISLLFSLH